MHCMQSDLYCVSNYGCDLAHVCGLTSFSSCYSIYLSSSFVSNGLYHVINGASLLAYFRDQGMRFYFLPFNWIAINNSHGPFLLMPITWDDPNHHWLLHSDISNSNPASGYWRLLLVVIGYCQSSFSSVLHWHPSRFTIYHQALIHHCSLKLVACIISWSCKAAPASAYSSCPRR